MRPLQHSHALHRLGTPVCALRIDGVLPLQARRRGLLVVEAGQVWITRSGDRDDHVLCPGQAITLGRGQRLVAEPWRSGQVAQLRWAVDAPAVLRLAGGGLAWRVAAWALGSAARVLASAARRAESRAGAAQGSAGLGDAVAAATGVLR